MKNIPKINWNLLPPKICWKWNSWKFEMQNFFNHWRSFKCDWVGYNLKFASGSTINEDWFTCSPNFDKMTEKGMNCQNKCESFLLTLKMAGWVSSLSSSFWSNSWSSSQFERCWPSLHPIFSVNLIKFLIFQHMM